MVQAQTRIRPRKWDAQNSLQFWDTNESSNLSETTRPSDSQKKKRWGDVPKSRLYCSGWPQGKTEKSEKKDKYEDFAWELKKTAKHESDRDTKCNWRAWHIHQSIDTVIGGLEIRRRVETIKITVLLRLTRILSRVLKTWKNLLSLKLQGKTII